MNRSLGGAPLSFVPLLLLLSALATLVLFAVLFDNGTLLAPFIGDAARATNYLHELFHDGRHLLGAPCH